MSKFAIVSGLITHVYQTKGIIYRYNSYKGTQASIGYRTNFYSATRTNKFKTTELSSTKNIIA